MTYFCLDLNKNKSYIVGNEISFEMVVMTSLTMFQKLEVESKNHELLDKNPLLAKAFASSSHIKN